MRKETKPGEHCPDSGQFRSSLVRTTTPKPTRCRRACRPRAFSRRTKPGQPGIQKKRLFLAVLDKCPAACYPRTGEERRSATSPRGSSECSNQTQKKEAHLFFLPLSAKRTPRGICQVFAPLRGVKYSPPFGAKAKKNLCFGRLQATSRVGGRRGGSRKRSSQTGSRAMLTEKTMPPFKLKGGNRG